VALHNHILLNGHVKNPPRDIEEAIEWLRQLVLDIDMKVIQGPYASYVDVPGNKGLTAAVMIETSHIAFHVWDEEDPALLQFDLYTCSTLPVPIVIKSIDKWMQFVDYKYIVYERATGFNVVEESSYGYEV
jgi:S-adenosylmethionine/arginine decarboxylase-like enzyme